MAILAILAATLAWPQESLAAATPRAAGVIKPSLLVDGAPTSQELVGIDSLEWRAGDKSLAPLLLNVTLANGPIFKWLQESLAGGSSTGPTRTLDLTVTESGKLLDAWRLTEARIVQVAFDDFNATSKVAWHYKLTIQATSAAPLHSANPRVPTDPTVRLKPFLQSNYRVSIGGLPELTTNAINAVTGLTVKFDGGSPFVTAALTSSLMEYGVYSDWRANVIRHTTAESASPGTQDLVISLLAPDMKAVMATMTLPKAALRRMTFPLGTAPSVTKFEIGLTADSLLLAMNTSPTAAAPPVVPSVEALPSGTLHATVSSGQMNRYSATVGSGTYVISLTGVVGAANLGVFTDAALTQPVTCIADNLNTNTYSQPEDCSFDSAGGTIYANVTGMGNSGSTYNIRISPKFNGTPINQGTQANPMVVTPDKPFNGSVGPAWSDFSYYVVNTIGTGDVVISMTGQIDKQNLDMTIYDNPGYIGALTNTNCYTGQRNSFAESCVLPAGKTYYVSVITRSWGGPFTLMVDSPPGTVAPPAAAAPTNVMQQALPASSAAP